MNYEFDDIEFIVCAANIAGYLEVQEKNYIESDTHLTEFILEELKEWRGHEWTETSFQDYIHDRLISEFGFKED